jgi:hypothetical protein
MGKYRFHFNKGIGQIVYFVSLPLIARIKGHSELHTTLNEAYNLGIHVACVLRILTKESSSQHLLYVKNLSMA